MKKKIILIVCFCFSLFQATAPGTIQAAGDKPKALTFLSLLLGNDPPVINSKLTFSKDAFAVKESGEAVITLSVNDIEGTVKEVVLNRVSIQGTFLEKVGTLLDDGKTSTSGDDVQGDGVFTYKLALNADSGTGQAGELFYLAKVTTTSNTETSEINRLIVYAQPTSADLQYTQTTAANVASKWAVLAPTASNFSDQDAYINAFETAQNQLVAYLQADPKNIFAISGTNAVIFAQDGMPFIMMQETIPDLTQWHEPLDGANPERGEVPVMGKAVHPVYTTGSMTPKAAQFKATAVVDDKNIIKNKNALFIDPYYWQHVHSTKMTDANGGWTKILASDSPDIDPTVSVLNGTDASLNTDPKRKTTEIIDAFTTMYQYGSILIHTHGGIGEYKGGSWFSDLIIKYEATSNPITKALLKYYIETIVQSNILTTGQLVVLSTDTYIDNTFLDMLAHKYASDIQLGRLYVTTAGKILVTPSFISKHNGEFPNSMVWLGACHSLENTTLSSVFLNKGAGATFGFDESVYRSWNVSRAGVVFENMLKNGKTAKEAFDKAIEAGNDDGHGTSLVLAGNNDLVYSTGLLNPSFEDPDGVGSLQSWTVIGDARAWKYFQDDSPTHGKTMAVVSSGLGNTVEYGSISQTFKMPKNASTMTFHWNFYSAEFKEYCNKGYDDTFRILINGVELFRTSVDTLCADQDGLIPALPIDNTADTLKSGWNTATMDVSAYADTNVNMKVEVSDKGDTIYDTAVLVDDFKILEAVPSTP